LPLITLMPLSPPFFAIIFATIFICHHFDIDIFFYAFHAIDAIILAR